MATKPAQSEEKTTPVVDAQADPVSQQHTQKTKQIAEDAKRKEENVVKKRWLQVVRNISHKKGGKVSLCSRMTNGNVHRVYLGRETQVGALVKKYQEEGLKIELM